MAEDFKPGEAVFVWDGWAVRTRVLAEPSPRWDEWKVKGELWPVRADRLARTRAGAIRIGIQEAEAEIRRNLAENKKLAAFVQRWEARLKAEQEDVA